MSFWVISQPNVDGLCFNMAHFQALRASGAPIGAPNRTVPPIGGEAPRETGPRGITNLDQSKDQEQGLGSCKIKIKDQDHCIDLDIFL